MTIKMNNTFILLVSLNLVDTPKIKFHLRFQLRILLYIVTK